MTKLGQHLLYISLISASYLGSAQAAYYDTLPKGVRMVVLKQVNTSTIGSAYNETGTDKPYFFKIDLDAENLEGFSEITKATFQQVASISQEAYDQFTLGQYEAQGSADVAVKGTGFAWGLTNRMTAYGALPYYNAQVNLDIKRTQGNNNTAVVESLNAAGNSTEASLISTVTSQIPDITGEVVQSVIVNGFNYQPLGNWTAEGPGDLELGVIYRLTDWDYSGLAMTGGVVLPTGREDDPDILQDFAFGDGQTDLFVEFGGGITLPNTGWSFDSYLRYTYQFQHNKELRVPESSDFPYGSDSAIFQEKLGNIYNFSLSSTYQFTRWLGLSAQYLHSYQGSSSYDSEYSYANEIYEQDTIIEQNSVRLTTSFSTVPLYQSGDFFLPFAANFSAQKMIGGVNTPNFSRYDIEFRFFF